MTKPAKPPTAQLKLRLVDKNGSPMNIPEAVLVWDGFFIQCKTNSDGVLIPFDADHLANPPVPVIVSKGARQGDLDLKLAFPPGDLFRSTMQSLRIFLDDFGGSDTPRGATARLSNLGYAPVAGAPATALPASMSPAVLAGLKRFRQANDIAAPAGPPGTIDSATSARLADAHDNPKGSLLK